NAQISGRVNAIAVQADGKVLTGGTFSSVAGQTRNRLARLHTQGSLDANFPDTDSNSRVYSVVVQPDGQLLVGGWLDSIAGQVRSKVARLSPNGTLDTTFNPPLAAGGEVYE